MAMRKNAAATGARAAVPSTATAEALQRKENDIKKSFKVWFRCFGIDNINVLHLPETTLRHVSPASWRWALGGLSSF